MGFKFTSNPYLLSIYYRLAMYPYHTIKVAHVTYHIKITKICKYQIDMM